MTLARYSVLRAVAVLALSSAPGWCTLPSAQETLNGYLQRDVASCRDAEQRMDVEIEASLPTLQKRGSMKGLKVVSKSGEVAYRFLRFTGDKLVKSDVIVRFLTAEAHPPDHSSDVAITAKNYKFHFLRTEDYRGSTAYVFQVRPRKKRVGLYKGELWLDAASSTPVRESGELVKSPSIFIGRVQFVREYSADDPQLASCGQPERMSINVQTRIVGDADLVVRQHSAASDWVETVAEAPAN